MQKTVSEIQNELIEILEEFNELLFGFAYVGDVLCEKEHLPYAITIGMPLSAAIADSIATGPNQAYYDEYLSLNDKLDLLTDKLVFEIQKNGYLASAILASKRTDFVNIRGDFPHKAAAVRGGLGWIGKSSLLVTKRYGPRVRISTVLTNIPFQTDSLPEQNHCGRCKKCVESCPANAITGNDWQSGASRELLIDVKKCDVWKIKNYQQFNGHVCGICVSVCPHGSSKK